MYDDEKGNLFFSVDEDKKGGWMEDE